MTASTRDCAVCKGTGRVEMYRVPWKKLPCHYCDGRGWRWTSDEAERGYDRATGRDIAGG